MDAYITETAAFLPGRPITNQELDQVLGPVNRLSARTRQVILASNGIRTRHYAVDPATGKLTHTNAQLTAQAVRKLETERFSPQTIQCLCCGTSSPDQLMPGHGSMVHGELGGHCCEVVSTTGICVSGMAALKYGAMSVAQGMTDNAVATGSELASSFLRTDFFQPLHGGQVPEPADDNPAFSFEAEFLRWMLSDGAGAVLLESTPSPAGLSLRIDWLDIHSHAHELEACMYAGAVKEQDGSLTGWRECLRTGRQDREGIFTVKQDARLLNREVVRTLVGKSLPAVARKYGLRPEDIDWFLPHYSSDFFRQPLQEQLEKIGFPLPYDCWFTNLASKGNTGSASFYIMLEELFHSGNLRPGERILGFVPESGRFAVAYILLTVV